MVAELAATLDAREADDAILGLLEPHAGSILVVGRAVFCRGAADRFRAMLLAPRSGSNFDELYRSAHELEANLRAPALQTRTLAWWARDLLRFGPPAQHERARELAARSRASATQVGMQGVVRDLDHWGFTRG